MALLRIPCPTLPFFSKHNVIFSTLIQYPDDETLFRLFQLITWASTRAPVKDLFDLIYKEIAFKRLRLILCLPLEQLFPQMTPLQSDKMLFASLFISGYLHNRILSGKAEGFDLLRGVPIRNDHSSILEKDDSMKFASENPRLLRRHIMMFIRSSLRYLSPETLKEAIVCKRWSVKPLCNSPRVHTLPLAKKNVLMRTEKKKKSPEREKWNFCLWQCQTKLL